MTEQEILNTGQFFDKSDKEPMSVFKIDLFIPFFDKSVNVEAFNLPSVDSKSVELSLLTKVINQIIDYNFEELDLIKEKIWEHFTVCTEKSERELYMIYNPQDAYDSLNLNLIHFDLSQLDYPHFNIEFSCPWEQEHGILICIAEGQFESLD